MVAKPLPVPEAIYFISDLHLGVPDAEGSLKREQLFISWLHQIKKDATALYIVGDLFDFWFEYKQVVPRGFVRTLGTLAQLRDDGLPIYFFTGNHDLWMDDYFEKELGIPVYHKPQQYTLQGKQVYVAHGDGLGPGDYGYKFLKSVFRSPLSKWLYARLHPNLAVWLGKKWSYDNRWINGIHLETFQGEDKEWLILYAREYLKKQHIDYFIFGHRHLALTYPLSDSSTYINLGDWLTQYTYARMENGVIELLRYS